MNAIEKLIDEHDEIERCLGDLEIAIEDGVNYPNLLHTLKKITSLWNSHEEKEEKLFKILAKEEVRIPVFKMSFDHKKLRGHREAIIHAINSGSEELVKDAICKDGEYIIHELKRHIEDEEGILRMISMDMFNEEEIRNMDEAVRD